MVAPVYGKQTRLRYSPHRSRMIIQLVAIHTHGLLGPDELERFRAALAQRSSRSPRSSHVNGLLSHCNGFVESSPRRQCLRALGRYTDVPSSCSAWTWRSVMRVIIRGLPVVLLAALMNGQLLAAPPSCGDLAGLSLPGATITLEQTVGAGAFAPLPAAAGAPSAGAAEQTFNAPRAFCRVAATLRPSTDSDVHIEVWMPVTN